jgi:hypothetical protein
MVLRLSNSNANSEPGCRERLMIPERRIGRGMRDQGVRGAKKAGTASPPRQCVSREGLRGALGISNDEVCAVTRKKASWLLAAGVISRQALDSGAIAGPALASMFMSSAPGEKFTASIYQPTHLASLASLAVLPPRPSLSHLNSCSWSHPAGDSFIHF